jgi:hypothetical protein
MIRVPQALCAHCGALLDGASTTFPDPRLAPRPGDVTFCLGCGGLLMFGPGLRVRLPGPGELEAAIAEQPQLGPQLLQMRQLVRSFVRDSATARSAKRRGRPN